MKSKFELCAPWAIASCALLLALAGCDSVKDVREAPSTSLPSERVVLQGVINGLGGGRGITLMYNTNLVDAKSYAGADPVEPTAQPVPIPFSFGALDAGTDYNLVVSGQPFGKQCTVANGSGKLTVGVETFVVVTCTSSIPRYDLTVGIPALPAAFSGLPGAKVIVKTGEQMFEKAITSGQTSVTFDDVLYNAAGQPAPFVWSVLASYVDADGNENRCHVDNFTNPVNPSTTPATVIGAGGTAVSNPIGVAGGPEQPRGDISTPLIGDAANPSQRPCEFTISGSVAYSAPPGGTVETGTLPGGMLLEVRDEQNKVKASYQVDQYGSFTIGGTLLPTYFPSNINSIYDIVVARQPTGRTCVVGDGGAASLYRGGATNPVNITAVATPGAAINTRAWGSRLNVFCRLRPATDNQLAGTYRLTSSTRTAAPTVAVPNPVPITAEYRNYDTTVQNVGSSNMMTFFSDGTFLYGTHAYGQNNLPTPATPSGQIAETAQSATTFSVQVEHGFYDYIPDPDNNAATNDGTIRFTLITDTNPTSVYPSTFSNAPGTFATSSFVQTPGLSAAPAPIVNGTPVAGAGIGIWTVALNKIQKSTVSFTNGVSSTAPQTLRRIKGTFGTQGTTAMLDWELTEPQSLNGEMTGSWISRDSRRSWVWDYLTYYGTQVGVLGGAPTMTDACFTMEKVHVSYGNYTRRGTTTGCIPFNRPAKGQSYATQFGETVDFHLTATALSSNSFVGVPWISTATGASVFGSRLVPQFGSTQLATLPGFVGRIPGGQSAVDGRSPSPVVFRIAPAATFASSAASTIYEDVNGQPATYFFDDLATVGAFTDWCSTEILAIRATLQGVPINYPVYLCRTRATP